MIEYMRERYVEIILAILDRINCVIEHEVLPDDIFEDYDQVPLNINSNNPIKKYIAKAMAEAKEDALNTFISKYGEKVMIELIPLVEKAYIEEPLEVHDCAVDVDIDRARLDTLLEIIDYNTPEEKTKYGTVWVHCEDSRILKEWLTHQPTACGRETWS